MSQQNFDDRQDKEPESKEKAPAVSILPVGNPVPLPIPEADTGQRFPSNDALDRDELNLENSNKGDKK